MGISPWAQAWPASTSTRKSLPALECSEATDHGPMEVMWITKGKHIGKPWENGGLMGSDEIYPLVMTNIAVESHHV